MVRTQEAAIHTREVEQQGTSCPLRTSHPTDTDSSEKVYFDANIVNMYEP